MLVRITVPCTGRLLLYKGWRHSTDVLLYNQQGGRSCCRAVHWSARSFIPSRYPKSTHFHALLDIKAAMVSSVGKHKLGTVNLPP